MNWVGGARSRLNRKSEKKIQQQFFEEKRKTKRKADVISSSQSVIQCNNWPMSQDLLSFKRLTNAYSSEPVKVSKAPKQARFVDLDDCSSRSRFQKIKEFNSSFGEKDLKPSILDLSDTEVRNFKRKTRFSSQSNQIKSFHGNEFEESNGRKSPDEMLSESIIDIQDSEKHPVLCMNSINTGLCHEELETSKSTTLFINSNTQSKLVIIPEEKASAKFQEIQESKDFFNLF